MATRVISKYSSSIDLTSGRAVMIGVINSDSASVEQAQAAAATQFVTNDVISSYAYDDDIHSFTNASFSFVVTDGVNTAPVVGVLQRSLDMNRTFTWQPFKFVSRGVDFAFTAESGPFYVGVTFSYTAPDGTIKTGRVYQDASPDQHLTWGALDPATFPVGEITVHSGTIVWGPLMP
jgi:hypothetical protein